MKTDRNTGTSLLNHEQYEC